MFLGLSHHIAIAVPLFWGLALSINVHRLYNQPVIAGKLPRTFPDVQNHNNGHGDGYKCALHFGHLDELPFISPLLKSANFKSSFTIYTAKTPPAGIAIDLEPVEHLNIVDDGTNLFDVALENNKAKINHLLRTKLVAKQEYPFDLSLLGESQFDATQKTRVVIGGYLSTSQLKWINKIVADWRKLDPSGNVVKFTWEGGNRGVYSNAAHNSRLAGRHLSVFLHYLAEIFSLDLDKVHLVGHSLGAQIAGFVGADFDGKIARITGLDPAGLHFADAAPKFRLDPTDAKFVDVWHTNAGNLHQGHLGTERPSGHVDYYFNGGSEQPGCYGDFRPHDFVCSHGRAIDFFDELLEREAQHSDIRRPVARLVQVPDYYTDLNRLAKMVEQPRTKLATVAGSAPLRHEIRVDDFSPNFPRSSPGIYAFATQAAKPFFAGNQYALTFKSESAVDRPLTLSLELDEQVIFRKSVDFSVPQSFVFASPRSENQLDAFFETPGRTAPPLKFRWHENGLSLVPMNLLHLKQLDVRPLDAADDSRALRYQAKDGKPLLVKSLAYELEGHAIN